MKKIFIMSILLVALVLMTNQVAYAGGEPPGSGFSIVGPTMDGVVYLTPGSPGYLDGLFLGNCNGKPFVIDIPSVVALDISEVDAASLINYLILDWGPAGCRSASGGEDLMITAVKNFSNDGQYVLADVDLKFVLPK